MNIPKNVTVRDFLQQNPDAALDLMTPSGLVQVPAGYGPWLLSDRSLGAKMMVNGTKERIPTTELLTQVIYKIVPYRRGQKRVFLLTKLPAEVGRTAYMPQIEYQQMSFDLKSKAMKS